MNEKNRKHRGSPPGAADDRGKVVRCLSCAHYYITHDPAFPYGCRAVGFKSRLLPSQEVFASSGLECQCFSGKAKGIRR